MNGDSTQGLGFMVLSNIRHFADRSTVWFMRPPSPVPWTLLRRLLISVRVHLHDLVIHVAVVSLGSSTASELPDSATASCNLFPGPSNLFAWPISGRYGRGRGCLPPVLLCRQFYPCRALQIFREAAPCAGDPASSVDAGSRDFRRDP